MVRGAFGSNSRIPILIMIKFHEHVLCDKIGKCWHIYLRGKKVMQSTIWKQKKGFLQPSYFQHFFPSLMFGLILGNVIKSGRFDLHSSRCSDWSGVCFEPFSRQTHPRISKKVKDFREESVLRMRKLKSDSKQKLGDLLLSECCLSGPTWYTLPILNSA